MSEIDVPVDLAIDVGSAVAPDPDRISQEHAQECDRVSVVVSNEILSAAFDLANILIEARLGCADDLRPRDEFEIETLRKFAKIIGVNSNVASDTRTTTVTIDLDTLSACLASFDDIINMMDPCDLIESSDVLLFHFSMIFHEAISDKMKNDIETIRRSGKTIHDGPTSAPTRWISNPDGRGELRQIPGFERYFISRSGRVFSQRRYHMREIMTSRQKNGQLRVQLNQVDAHGKKTSRLVRDLVVLAWTNRDG